MAFAEANREQLDPSTHIGRGYALLLKVWAMGTRTVQHADIERGRRTDPSVWLYMAWVAFNSAILLERGDNPWASGPTLVDSKKL